jgi:hypothetical protein
MLHRRLFLILFLAPLAACTSAPAPSTAQLNHDFKIKVDQSAVIAAEGLTIRFTALSSESRCPRGVQCVQAGEAAVSITIAPENGGPVTFVLNTNPPLHKDRATVGDYEIQLKAVEPYPASLIRPNPQDYVVTLVVTHK